MACQDGFEFTKFVLLVPHPETHVPNHVLIASLSTITLEEQINVLEAAGRRLLETVNAESQPLPPAS